MIWNNLKIAIRNLWRDKIYSFINLFGLAIGLASCMILSLYVIDEYSYDKCNKNHSRIYRMNTSIKMNEFELTHPTSSPVLAATLIEDFPEVIDATRILQLFEPTVIEAEGRGFTENNFYWTDPSIIKIFDLQIVKGNGDQALKNSFQVIISEKTALKYFGSIDIIGKQIKMEDSGESQAYTISAVAKDLPYNSHFHFNFLTSFKTHFKNEVTSYNNDGAYTYVLLDDKANADAFVKKVPGLVKKYIEPSLKTYSNMSLEEMEKKGDYYKMFAMPLTDIHLHSNSIYELEKNGNINNVYIFLFSSILILLIACVNFTNLSTAKSAQRAKEIGVRKSLGSSRKRLILQFLSESILLSFIALLVALLLVEFMIPIVNSLLEKELGELYYSTPILILLFLGIALFTGIFAGSYSAFYLSKFDPAKVLKGNLKSGNGKSPLRQTLVSLQLCISIFLFISTLITYQQMNYIKKKNLGFNKEDVLIIRNINKLSSKEAFKEVFLKNSYVIDASLSNNIPGGFYDGFSMWKTSGDDENPYSTRYTTADFDFAKTMGMKMAEGRYFSKDQASDKDGLVINEALVKSMNLTNPIGTVLKTYMGNKTIIGVIKDFHFVSLHMKIGPLVFLHPEGMPQSHLVVKFHQNRKKEVLSLLNNSWKEQASGFPLDYYFIDEQFSDLHKSENNTMLLFSIFSILSILITCLGLIGLSSFTTEKRTKEIGVRKVLGASNFSILKILNTDILRWMPIALIIASPIAWYIMNKWLEEFAYRINIEWYVFILSGIATLIISLIAISWQAWMATKKNPVDALRYE